MPWVAPLGMRFDQRGGFAQSIISQVLAPYLHDPASGVHHLEYLQQQHGLLRVELHWHDHQVHVVIDETMPDVCVVELTEFAHLSEASMPGSIPAAIAVGNALHSHLLFGRFLLIDPNHTFISANPLIDPNSPPPGLTWLSDPLPKHEAKVTMSVTLALQEATVAGWRWAFDLAMVHISQGVQRWWDEMGHRGFHPRP